jgi:hypothetical protein
MRSLLREASAWNDDALPPQSSTARRNAFANLFAYSGVEKPSVAEVTSLRFLLVAIRD